MKTLHKNILAASVAVGLLTVLPSANAALINVGSGVPDLTTSNVTLDYTFTDLCFSSKNDGTSGACGTSGAKGAQYDGVLDTINSYGLFTITDTSMTLYDGSNSYGITGGNYNLTANFDGTGNFVALGSDFSATYTGMIDLDTGSTTSTPYTSGTWATGDLTANGFGGIGETGIIEFLFNNTGGDLAAFADNGAITMNLLNAGWTGDWDSLNGGLNFWQHSFSSTTSDVDTFVPVPAAAWLFGSGLLALVGIARKKSIK